VSGWRLGHGDAHRVGLVIAEPGDDAQREPLGHAGLPDQRARFDHLEPEKIVELLERELLHLVGRESHVPEIVISHG
jgi:hypothetical protein